MPLATALRSLGASAPAPPVLPRVQDAPDVQQHATRLADLQSSLRELHARLTALVTERAALEQTRHAEDVAALVAGRRASEAAARLAARQALDADIVAARTELAALTDAIGQVQQMLHSAKAAVADRIRAQAAALAGDVLDEMRPLVERLEHIESQAPGPLLPLTLLRQFLAVAESRVR